MVANWDSNVGYAWWLMESYWIVISESLTGYYKPILAYPKITQLPPAIDNSTIQLVEHNFTKASSTNLISQLNFIIKNNVKAIYYTDQPMLRVAYFFFRMACVKKIIVHDHSPGLRIKPRIYKTIIKKCMNRLPWIVADACVGATEFITHRHLEINRLPPSRCFTVTNGIPVNLPQPTDLHQLLGINKNKKLIVTAARATRFKGGFFAIDVMAELLKSTSSPNWHYIYLGDGPDLKELKTYAAHMGTQNNVTFAGNVTNIKSLLQSAYVGFHPSKGEVGFSLSILEYMLCGLPVIVPDNSSVCGATRNGQTGLIYKEHSVKHAADMLSLIMEEVTTRELMGRQARKEILENYSINVSHQQLKSLIIKLCPG